MAIERIIPTDWSRSTSSSDHSNITDYQNALANTDSTTYGYWFWAAGDKYSYLKFSPSGLPSNIGPTIFKIKAASSATLKVNATVVYDGTTYDGEQITVNSSTETVYDIPMPYGISPLNLKGATEIYLTLYTSSAGSTHKVYGAEINIDTTAYKIFNLILPRG